MVFKFIRKGWDEMYNLGKGATTKSAQYSGRVLRKSGRVAAGGVVGAVVLSILGGYATKSNSFPFWFSASSTTAEERSIQNLRDRFGSLEGTLSQSEGLGNVNLDNFDREYDLGLYQHAGEAAEKLGKIVNVVEEPNQNPFYGALVAPFNGVEGIEDLIISPEAKKAKQVEEVQEAISDLRYLSMGLKSDGKTPVSSDLEGSELAREAYDKALGAFSGQTGTDVGGAVALASAFYLLKFPIKLGFGFVYGGSGNIGRSDNSQGYSPNRSERRDKKRNERMERGRPFDNMVT